jgi:hypothetical protein
MGVYKLFIKENTMLDTKVKISVGATFEPIPMGVYTTQITDVNLKEQAKFHSTELEQVLVYQFAILDEGKLEDGTELRGRFVWKRCRLSINDRSWLGKLAKAVLGRDMTDKEIEDFDPESLVGKQVVVMIEQQVGKTDKTQIFSNIMSFSPVKKQLEPISDDKGVAVAATTTTKSVVAEATPQEDDGEVDAEIAALEAQAALAAKKAAIAKQRKG